MFVSRIELKNWRNFRHIEADLQERMFLVGPNASGKSNFLDVFRFLRDIAQAGGGLQQAVDDRGGLSRIRCLAARQYPDVEVDVELSPIGSRQREWKYTIGIKQQQRGKRKPYIAYERVWHNDDQVLNRPDDKDKTDEERRTQTHLEQISANADFRSLAEYFETICYLHVVPQLVRYPREFSGPGLSGDPFGRAFLERMAKTPERTRKAWLRSIEAALKVAVPQLRQLSHVIDTKEGGIPHLEAVYDHWRPHGAIQRERDFSDGTLRLIGFLWSLLEKDTLLLLEEPELSLNAAIVRKLPELIHRALKKRKRQVLISTHSADLLSNRGIGPEEILLLQPSANGTNTKVASTIAEVGILLESGMSIGEAMLPHVQPEQIEQLELWPQ